MAAVTINGAGSPHDQSATCRRKTVVYTGPASYATGGDTGLADALGWGKIFALLGGIISNGTLTYLLYWNASTSAVMIFDMAGAEVANATDLSTFSGSVEVVGQ